MAARRIFLRIVVVLAFVLGAIAYVVGFFPGAHVYEDGVYRGTIDVVETPNWFAGFLLVLLLPGILLWRRPELQHGLAWSLWTLLVTMLCVIATLDFSGNERVYVKMLASHVFSATITALFGLLIVALPVASGAVWWFTRERREPPVTLPRARVVPR